MHDRVATEICYVVQIHANPLGYNVFETNYT